MHVHFEETKATRSPNKLVVLFILYRTSSTCESARTSLCNQSGPDARVLRQLILQASFHHSLGLPTHRCSDDYFEV